MKDTVPNSENLEVRSEKRDQDSSFSIPNSHFSPHPPALVPKLRFPEFREADGWTLEAGDSLFGQINNRNPEPGLHVLAITQEHGAIPRHMIDYHVSVTEKSIESYKVVRVGDFIISLRSFQGGIEYSLYHGICSPAYVILRRRGQGSDEYFRHYLKTDRFIRILTKNLEGLRDGKMISYAQFSELLLPTPKPAEQQKIAECLSSVDELLAAQARKVDALKTHKKGLMQQLFPREGETQPRLRFPEFQNAGEWDVKRVDEQGSVLAGKALAVDAPGPQRPYLRTKNVLDGAIDLSDVLTMPMSDAEFTRFEILDGDVLLNEGQSLELVGRASIYHGEFGQRCAMQNALLRFRAFPSTSAEFAAQYFRQCQKNGTFANVATKTTSVAHLGSSRFSALELAWPSPAEQKRIASCLSSLDALITAETQKHDALKTHKRGLMQQLFPSPEEATS
jgi:type I restriction enzyme S subunit